MKLTELIGTLQGLRETCDNDDMKIEVYSETDGHTFDIVAVYTWREDAIVITVRHDDQ